MTTGPFSAPETPLSELTGDQLRARVARAQMFLIYMMPAERWQEVSSDPQRQVLHDHFRYLKKLGQDGRLFGAGPVEFQPGRPVEGLAIIAAASREEAQRIAENEPFHKAGARRNTVRPHTINEGVACYVARAMDRRAKQRGDGFDPYTSGIDGTIEELTAHNANATLYLVQMEPTDIERTQQQRDEVLHNHFVWLRENEMAARLLSCGPTERLDGKPGGDSGLGIVAAPSLEAAQAIAAAEPNGIAGYRVLTTRRWLLNEGLAAPIGKSLTVLNA